jgi:heterodisulfide reductase subunit A2
MRKMAHTKPSGPVIVAGGGPSGIEAALSLADAGYSVHLIESSDSLGGMIPSLHRLYPLCACCKIDRNIAECIQNPAIEVTTNAELTQISGTAGAFTVTIKREDGQARIPAGAIVLATGVEPFDPSGHDTYQYSLLPNVLTAPEYELRQKPDGPDQGKITRPSDGNVPEKIAWLQCVGSRDINPGDAAYCSSVCCMYAVKEAVTTKDFSEAIQTDVFFMDLRAHGKGYEQYFNEAAARGVNFIRCRVHTVAPVPGTDDLSISFVREDGTLVKETFDMVVLSTGIKPSRGSAKAASAVGLELDGDGYAGEEAFRPCATSKPGIFVCGGLSAPAAVLDSITQGAAVVTEVSAILAPERLPKAKPPEMKPPEDETGIFVAYRLCPGMQPELGSRIEARAAGLPGVVGCAKVDADLNGEIVSHLQRTGAGRLVYAACSPEMDVPLLEKGLENSGRNPFLYQTVDLNAVDAAGSSAVEEAVRMGAARVALMSAPELKSIPVTKSALVVGGGVAGMEAALSVAEMDIPVTVVEKSERLGGHAAHVRCSWQGNDVQDYLRKLIERIKNNSLISVMTGTVPVKHSGFPGNFLTTVEGPDGRKEIAHGAAILATGADPLKPNEYLYGSHNRVVLWSELSEKLIADPDAFTDAGTAVFIQCVGSREPARPYCSNICCTFTVRAALDMKRRNPAMQIFVLYREMRTFGRRENIYREARDAGVLFLRYEPERKPVVEAAGERLKVTVRDLILDRDIVLDAGLVSLQTAIEPTGPRDMAGLFKVGTDESGFFAESPEKLKPVHSTRQGIYIAGLAHYPKDTTDSITQGRAAASAAAEILNLETVRVGGLVAEVDTEKCAACCTCVRTCPFGVPFIDPAVGAANINPALCRGCGICAAECPGKAIVMNLCSDRMLTEAACLLQAAS